MLRIVLLPLLLFTISMACMGQTFQYSRGWTNGKRSPFHRIADEENTLRDYLDVQDGERKLERCLLQLQHLVRNPLLLANGMSSSVLPMAGLPIARNRNNENGNSGHAVAGMAGSGDDANNGNSNGNSNNNSGNNNNSGPPSYNSRHQSTGIFEKLNPFDGGDYGRH